MTRDEIITKAAESRYDLGYSTTHARRYEKTLAFLKRHLPPGERILDISWPTIFDDILVELGFNVFNGEWDIRKEWPRDTGSAPVILLMEVVEHLKDPEPSSFDTFEMAGLKRALEEARRVLKPGGLLFISTPNAASAASLKRLARGGNPMLYTPHVREYAALEMEWWVCQAGLSIIERTTEACYEDTDQQVIEAIKALGGPSICRDDTTFILATR